MQSSRMYVKYQRYTKTKVVFAFTSGYLKLRLLKLVFCNYIFHIKLGHIHGLVQFNEVLYSSLKTIKQIEKTDENNIKYHFQSKKQTLKTCSKEPTLDNETCKTNSVHFYTELCP